MKRQVTSILIAAFSLAAVGASADEQDEARNAALREDWHAWSLAWQQLDAKECARLAALLDQGQPVSITLCGDRSARTWAASGAGLWQRVASVWKRQSAAQLLEHL